MKIGIVTIVDYTNYGNRLQNYAVGRVLESRFNCEAISLVSYKDKAFYNGNHTAWVKDQIAKKCCIFPAFAEKKWGNNITRWANFHSWTECNIPTKNYYECECLPDSVNDEYDMFIAGSDQIWNYHFSSNRFSDYFLNFAESGKKAALSASFGVESIPEKWREVYIDGFAGFKHISVREDAGAAIIKELLQREVPVLIDPVMLLSQNEWLRVAKKPRVDTKKPYVLKYYLGNEAEEEKIDRWASENGYEVYELLNDKIPELYSAGPGEFISLIANAALVASDSFHCIAFSIIFRRPFVVYARRGTGDYMTSRLDTLLGKFKMTGRWKHLLEPEDYLTCDFSETDFLMENEQKKALRYIKAVIDSVK